MNSSDMTETVRQFSLYLLSEMRASKQVGDALDVLGATHGEMNAAAELVARSGFLTPGHPFKLYQNWLGSPHTTEALSAEAASSFAGSHSHRFRLELWPGFDF